MRVLIATPWYPSPENPIRGIWTIDHARCLTAEHEVVMLAFSPREGVCGRFELSDNVEHGLRTFRIGYPPPRVPGLGLIAARAGTLEALARLETEGFVPDVVHAHVFLAAPAALTASRRASAPVVILENLTRVTENQLSWLERGLARFTYRRAALVCPTNEPCERAVTALGARRTKTMPNAFDIDLFHPPRVRDRGRDEIRAIAAGSLLEKKGHHHLLEAVAAARREEPRLVLDLIGDGPLRAELERQAASLGLDGAVRFRGYFTRDQLAEAFRRADLHLLSSLRENQPLVVAEAMATGLPTVGTRVGGVPEMLEGGAGVVVPPADPASFARAIIDVCRRLESYRPERLAELARRRYGRKHVADRWTEVYRAVLAEQERRSRFGRQLEAT